jgi:3'-phosphoadenosine 5'-phosphosulfate sulfotransferase (PAPS reductase)/FAD synthetase
VKVKISCPAAESRCAGTVSLRTLRAVTARTAAANSKRAVLTLASGSFSVAGGKVTTVILHLSAKARSLLARSHSLRVRVTIVAHDPAGAKHTEETVATMRALTAKRARA